MIVRSRKEPFIIYHPGGEGVGSVDLSPLCSKNAGNLLTGNAKKLLKIAKKSKNLLPKFLKLLKLVNKNSLKLSLA